ncbi:MAG: NUDIX hydrolase [Flavobacteriales bacterium]|nr:NUDIX hydrolase [Flavobacteriales bacterium]
MYKVFINDRSVFLTDIDGLEVFTGDYLCYSCDAKEELKFLYEEIVSEETGDSAVIILNENVKELIKDFESLFVRIDAAGGVVHNDKKEMLFIHRLGKWDLPKGKLEVGENITECAVREVQEECGITDLKIIMEAGITRHTYVLEGVPILKYTYWYAMECSQEDELIPQQEEGITEVKWIPKDGIAEVIKDTYPSIKDLLS